jgi:hypothetical protein
VQPQRESVATKPVWIEIDHRAGFERFEPDSQIAAIRQDPLRVATWQPIPDLTSIISARPAIVYLCGELAIPLANDEYAALVGQELEPAEMMRLRKVFGPAYEWRDELYEKPSRRALQPLGLRHLVLRALAL